MMSRVRKSLMALAMGIVVGVVPLAAAPPVGAAPAPASLTMVNDGGTLVIRDSDEPTKLEQPTRLAGTFDDSIGKLTGGTFVTPPVSYDFPITDPFDATVYVDAAFSEVAPGSVTATIDEEDNLTVEMVVKADLDIEVSRPAVLRAQCTATPIALRFASTAPYDREGTKRVTLRDADFTVPQVAITPECPEIVADGVNERLAGSGHSLEMTMQGEIPEVLGVGEPTDTALTVDPVVSRTGDEVVLGATVTQDDGGTEVPTGSVEFRDGSVVIGNAPLDGLGTATLPVSDLAVGQHSLTARYLGDGELYQSSASATVSHLVAAAPTIEVAMSDTAQIGGGSVPATVTVTNPAEFGDDIVNGRVDLTLRRTVGTGDFTPDRVVVEWRNGNAWEALTLTPGATPRTVVGSIGLPPGFRLDAGTQTELRLRVRFPAVGNTPSPTACGADNPTCPGPAELLASLVEVDPGTGEIREQRAEGSEAFTIVEATRRQTTLTLLGGAPRPHTLRAGYTVEAIANIGPVVGGVRPTGSAEFYVDGRLTPARRVADPLGEYTDQVPIFTAIQGLILLPPDIEVGRHVLTVRYLGDKLFTPNEVTTAFTVVEPDGPAYVCQVQVPNANHEFGANITFDADLPAAALSGTAVDLDITEASIGMSRAGSGNQWPGLANGATVEVGTPSLTGVAFGFGPEGSGTATSVSRSGGTAQAASPNPADASQIDQRITFGGPTGSVTVTGAPGDVVPVTLDEIVVSFNLINPPLDYQARCVPVDEPVELGEVEIAGTTVSVEPESPVRETTDDVTISAETFPGDAAGTVTFTSEKGGVVTTLGTDAVDGGAASITTDELSPGQHQIRASFDATDPAVPDTVSAPFPLFVIKAPTSATEAFVTAALVDFTGTADADDIVAGATAIDRGQSRSDYLRSLSRSHEWVTYVVQQMYIDTLGREGEQAGVDFWVDRILNKGWTVPRVAASFYSSNEYFANTGGTPEAWSADLYETLLGRQGSASEVAYWVDQIPIIGRGRVALRFYQTVESRRFRVAALYDYFLNRNPARADLDFWDDRVLARGDLVLAVSLAASGEYFNRAGRRFPEA